MNRTFVGICLMAIAAAPSAFAQEKAASTWTDRLSLKGDMRLREEYSKKEDDDSRNRLRLRARLALDAEVVPSLRAVIGLGSGQTDSPTSYEQTWGDGFTRKAIWLDLAYIEWSPQVLSGLSLDGGKMKNPFITVGDLIWDTDVNPEGLALKYKTGAQYLDVLVNAGAFWVEERHNAQQYYNSDEEKIDKTSDDTMLFAGQVGLKLKPAQDYYFLVGGGLYQYQNMADYEVLADSAKSYGNSTVSTPTNLSSNAKFYQYEYKLVEGLAEIGLKCPLTQLPVRLFGDYVSNSDPGGENKAFMLGVQYSQLKDAGSFTLEYNYRKLEKDAVVGAFTDSTSGGGGTDLKGHKIKGGYQIAKNVALEAALFLDKTNLSTDEKDYKCFQLDLLAKF